MYFYRLDPERVLDIPSYLVVQLLKYLPALQADEQQREITTALMPHIGQHDRRSFMHSLEKRAALLRPTPPREKVEFIEHNPELAKAYFESLGITVQNRTPHHE